MAASGARGAETDAVAEPPGGRATAHGAAHEAGAPPACPPCGSARVVHMLGDNGGVSLVCTSCGHSWS